MQQMVANNAHFAQVNSSVIIQANTKNDLPVKVVMANGVIDWSLAVLESSKIMSGADMKGKKVGLINLGTGGLFSSKAIWFRAVSNRPGT
jgi:NitT/TauT family transport system substrate-binding protein